MSGVGEGSSAEEAVKSRGSGATVFSRLRLSYTIIGLMFSVGGSGGSPNAGTRENIGDELCSW